MLFLMSTVVVSRYSLTRGQTRFAGQSPYAGPSSLADLPVCDRRHRVKGVFDDGKNKFWQPDTFTRCLLSQFSLRWNNGRR